MLHILLTFDYELFFNDSFYSEKEVLIDTTYEIKAALDEANVKGTFFVDAPCIYRYRELEQFEFPGMVEKQLNELLNDGHDIQLHLHPSWYDAKFDKNKWIFDQNSYSLENHKNPASLVKLAKNTLDSLVMNNPNYNCCAFRAGGFCLSPEREVLKALFDSGIRIDSSVCCGVKMESVAQTFDWSDVQHNGQWIFDLDFGIRSSAGICKKSMIEIPVGTYKKVPGKWLLTHGQPKLNYPPLKGKTSPVESKAVKNWAEIIKERVCASFNTPVMFVMDNLHANALCSIAREYLNVAKRQKDDCFICAIGHPKFYSTKCVDNMMQFITRINHNYKGEIDFVTIKDAYNMLLKNNN